ncbi:DNA-binding transcriptional regulator YbjK [Saccharopolyspora antimicrobica]|uniref:DNA-binding transcriptional regulator YbjK n=2 Tax=Saccharopolyspora antimicrobica TaxID=455193 RepID=A0A1I5FDP7_9PSEU|nr:TetR family transcriptional regulator [Saccharopolyspora antimicrobica]SFO21875.1 DNA-binding transcriptional regulator YbjK [Saccharopolyspora antimicrobica]
MNANSVTWAASRGHRGMAGWARSSGPLPEVAGNTGGTPKRMSTTQPAPAARRKDPARPERIARAAIAVVAERGVDKLTHRAVAAQAGVPLGSTTYYFATLDDLLASALRQAAADDVAHLREWAQGLNGDLAVALTDLVLHYLGPARAQTAVEHQLYIAALHKPALHGASQEWDSALAELFASLVDPATGRALSVVFCGLLLQGIVRESVPSRDEIEMIFRRVLPRPAES